MKPDACIMKWSVVERVLVMCASSGRVGEESFRPFLDVVAEADIDASLVLGLGSVQMSVIQRTDAAKLLKRKGFKAVTLTDSRVIRGIMTAMSWFGGNVSSAPLDDLEGALDSLGLHGERREAVRREVESVRERVEQERRLQRAG